MSLTTSLSDWYANLTNFKRWLVRGLIVLLIIIFFLYKFFLPPDKVNLPIPISPASSEAAEASQLFWDTFHGGETDLAKIEAMIAKLTEAIATAEDDLVLHELLGVAHYWKYQQRSYWSRSAEEMKPELEKALVLGKRAVELTPDLSKSTMPSLVAMSNWNLAKLADDQEAMKQVELDIVGNTFLYPAFASFIQAWVLNSTLKPEDPNSRLSLQGMHYMLASCAGFTVANDMKFTHFSQTMFWLKIWIFGDPVCYNNQIAPHNVEGAFINQGDILLKAGDKKSAIIAYNNTKTSPTFDTWKYKPLLLDRLARPDYYQKKFIADSGYLDVEEPALGYQSRDGCAICHSN